mmetsp:Transcript_54074/g.110343  ORF Transcript_54074/g.110343 Transcript_54074/m.110343 type:complete len:179 (-) Transcript_54074:399-935(-)|eukprot:CAMPEP_0181295370 /NCGR_PEP_ID=MMETSP1101-20121128/4111_1 /TAXON_ID=46948 /ORGANISM="Rhodomonas abbreviata, Strain Caron Lab Isolate" /LENGTH=178 /DNA_ID=CAMNT_0023400117 /DNA_START=9 /DNA_END=545 /DNA_ORIENTATION=+
MQLLRRSVLCTASTVMRPALRAASVNVPRFAAAARPSFSFISSPVRTMSTVGSDGTDSDFAPKAKTPPPSSRDVQAEIKEMVHNRKVVLFMKGTPDFPMCGFSNRAVQILDHHSAAYGAFNVLEDHEVREGIKQFSSWPTIPQLFVNGEFLGGCDIMMEMHENGELLQALTDAEAIRK